jgi:Mrp family chromosome partitioning ATPase
MASLAGELSRGPSRSVWLTARARNAVARPQFIAIVGGLIFIAALVALILAPQQLRRGTTTQAAPVGPRPDTSLFAAALDEARKRLTAAEGSLAQARLAPQRPQVQEPIIPPAILTQRDSLSTVVSDLDALLTRVEGAPVTASYRALAESPQLAANPRVRVLLDSLGEVEREREAFGTTGGADPVYLALTSRSTEIGRSIQAIAQDRRDEIRRQIASLNVPAQRPTVVQTTVIDTASWVAERDSARSLVEQANVALGESRAKAKDFDQEVARARQAAAAGAPPSALLGAAMIIGIALGFGVAFVDELRRPRISDAHEAERATGVRVLATVRPRPRDPDRMRRSTDKLAPPYFDPAAAPYQLTYLHLARTGASRLVLTVVSADPNIAAVVAMNVAAIAADEARSTILIDTDVKSASIAAALRCHAEPGLADVIQQRIDWSEVTTQTMIGRDRVIDIIPSGISPTGIDRDAIVNLFRQEGTRLARHYEAIVVVGDVALSEAGLPGALPVQDTVICARAGHTRLSELEAALDAVRRGGGNPSGIVLWDATPPVLPTPETIAGARRPLQTAEMQTLTTKR